MKSHHGLHAGLLTLLLSIAAMAAQPAAAAAWTALTATQQQSLAPLEREWGSLDAQRQSKWLAVATQFPLMPADERARMHARMAEWARLTPAERSRARLQYQDARPLSASERQAKWQAYQALSEDDRHALAQKAKPTARSASSSVPAAVPAAAAKAGASGGKQNVVQAAEPLRSRAVSPMAQQVRPGATTTTITARAPPPTHNQAGLPKIAATPGFVDPSTLLPQRGPQGAAVRSAAAASEPAAQR